MSDTTPTTEQVRIYGGAVLVGLFACVTVLLLSALYFLVRNAQDGQVTRELLVECTIPPAERTPPLDKVESNDCYVRSQQRGAAALAQVQTISAIAAACGAANPGDIPATRACLEEGLAR